jgi:outer membrane immunogenic protein
VKKTTLSIIIIATCVFCGATYGGPEVINPGPAAAPPTPSSTIDWTGFHLGIFGGYIRGEIDPDTTLGGTFNQIPPVKNGLESRGSEDFGTDGGELGGLIGFDYQLNRWVIGFECAGGYLWSRGSTDTGAFILGPGIPPLEIRSSLETHYLFTAAPRIGYAVGRFLPYVTGGLAVGDLDWSQKLHDLAPPGGRLAGNTTETNAGWMVGGGLQYALTDNWSARVQYQFVDLGSASFDSTVNNSPTFTGHLSGGLEEHHAIFGLVYKF